MQILTHRNKPIDSDLINSAVFYSVLSFRDYKNPDFYMEKLNYLDEVDSSSVAIRIGKWKLVMPYTWSIIVTDFETLECVPLYETIGKTFTVFCLNPIDGYVAQFFPLKTGMIYPNTTWTAPPVAEKDMLVVPLGYEDKKIRYDREGKVVEVGPVCAIFSPTKMEINKPISDIW